MAQSSSNQPSPHSHPPARDAARAVVATLQRAGHIAYFAGGCVRDELLGRHPDDYDVATDATPDRITALFDRTSEVGASFGVVLVKVGRGPNIVAVEVATFRSDGAYTDRRRPDRVHFSDPSADAQRRDFTINALFLDPMAPESRPVPQLPVVHGRVIDLVGGLADLQSGTLRAVGDADARLAEDHLRALRAVRLAARLNFNIEPLTAAAIVRHARELSGISRERIGEEVRKILGHPTRARGVALLESLHLDQPVLNETAPAPPAVSGAATLLAGLPSHQSPDSVLPTCLAAWAIGRGMNLALPGSEVAIDQLVSHWRAALCLSNDERDGMASLLRVLRGVIQTWNAAGVALRKRLAASRWFGDALHILHADSEGKWTGCSPALRERVVRETDELAATPSGLAPPPLVTGDTLVAAGLKPGPGFRALLDAVYDAQLEDRVVTADQALRLAISLAASGAAAAGAGPGKPRHGKEPDSSTGV